MARSASSPRVGSTGPTACRPSQKLLVPSTFARPFWFMLRHACDLGLEGVVAKGQDSPYRSGRREAWLKIKCTNAREIRRALDGKKPFVVEVEHRGPSCGIR